MKLLYCESSSGKFAALDRSPASMAKVKILSTPGHDDGDDDGGGVDDYVATVHHSGKFGRRKRFPPVKQGQKQAIIDELG